MGLTDRQLHDLYWKGPQAVVQYIKSTEYHLEHLEELLGHRQQLTIDSLSRSLGRVKNELRRVKKKLAQQECLVYDLTRRLQQAQQALAQSSPQPVGKDSHNSHLPPSSDPPAVKQANSIRRTRSLKKRSGLRPGGQPGHPGRTLLRVEQPDHVVVHAPEVCRQCSAPLTTSPAVGLEKRQVFDVPPVKIEVTEHRAESRRCLSCGARTKASFPERVKAPVQYGEGVRARALYLQKYQLLPFERTSEAMRDLFGCGMRASTLFNAREACSRKLLRSEARIKAALQQSKVMGVDETGARVAGKGHWIHVARTDRLRHYACDWRRGSAAIDAIAILPAFRGKLVHDAAIAYEQYHQCEHSLCAAHLLRELVFVSEAFPQHQGWSSEMIELLLKMKAATDEARQSGQEQISIKRRERFLSQYEELIGRARQVRREEASDSSIRVSEVEAGGRTRPRDPTSGLLRRLDERREEVLRFMSDLEVPFDHNGSERDLRMVKLQQKVGGCFRTPEGAEAFCRIRSYLSTARKQGHALLAALARVLRGKPLPFASS